MDALVTSIVLSGALIALTFSIISLVLHWIRRTETPEYTALSGRITELDLQILNVMDQVKHWRSRDSVRKAREGAQKKLDEAEQGDIEVPYKTQLRRRVIAANTPKAAA